MDVNELTRKALEASARDDSEAAIAYLKEATEQDAGAAVPHFLLGAEYAQIGIIDRAIAEMGRAVANDPDLAIARFQLGLLHLTSGRVDEAAATWQPLEALGELHPLRLFQAGLLQMAHDRFAEAKFLIAEGIERNTDNAALNRDMKMVIARIEQAESAPPEAAGGDHVLVSAYKTT
jgi:tetratricopeptide (TPR) repeat protein